MTLGRATEVNPGTSSQAFSNFSGRAAFNPNDDIAYRSNYDIKARLLGALTWQHHFFGDYATSVSAFYDGHSGQPYSFVYGNDANGDGVSNNDLVLRAEAGPGAVRQPARRRASSTSSTRSSTTTTT